MDGFLMRGKPEYPEKNPQESGRDPPTHAHMFTSSPTGNRTRCTEVRAANDTTTHKHVYVCVCIRCPQQMYMFKYSL